MPRVLKAVQPYLYVKSVEAEFAIDLIDQYRETAKTSSGRNGDHAYRGW